MNKQDVRRSDGLVRVRWVADKEQSLAGGQRLKVLEVLLIVLDPDHLLHIRTYHGTRRFNLPSICQVEHSVWT